MAICVAALLVLIGVVLVFTANTSSSDESELGIDDAEEELVTETTAPSTTAATATTTTISRRTATSREKTTLGTTSTAVTSTTATAVPAPTAPATTNTTKATTPPRLAATGGVGLGVRVPNTRSVSAAPGPSGKLLPPYGGWLGKLGPHQDDGRPSGGPRSPTLGPGIAPLTGMAANVPTRPAIVAKIDNSGSGRPQAGLNNADIVYEERVEGSVTRLAAVFHSSNPGVIGPIRSARTTDIGIVGSFREPIFSWSGSNEVFANLIRRQPIVDRGADVFGGYGRSPQRRAPYNLFTDTNVLWGSASGRAPVPHFAYRAAGSAPTTDSKPATSVRLKFGGTVSYSWDIARQGWARSQAGRAHNDSNGLRVAPPNVVVQFVAYGDTGLRDVTGAPVPEATMIGSGSALVFTGGRVINATWTKASLFQPTRFTDRSGKLIELAPGPTWVELIEPGLATVG